MWVEKPDWVHWLIQAWVPRGRGPHCRGFPEAVGRLLVHWVPLCAVNRCEDPQFCLATEHGAPMLLGSHNFSSCFFSALNHLQILFRLQLSWNRKTKNHRARWKWGKCSRWASWPRVDMKARLGAEGRHRCCWQVGAEVRPMGPGKWCQEPRKSSLSVMISEAIKKWF